MHIQDSLPGFDVDTRPTDRLFLAIFPDSETATQITKRIESLRPSLGLSGNPIKTDRLHVTLHHLGDYVGLPNGIVESAMKACATIKQSPFEVEFDRVESFSGRSRNRPFVLRGDQGLDELHTFRKNLSDALVKEGLGKWATPQFTPHLTLLYDDQLIPPTPTDPIHWETNEFVLVHSHLGKTKHIPLSRWTLN